MVKSEAIKKLRQHFEYLKHAWKPHPDYETMDAIGYAIQALEKQEKIKEAVTNANKWSKEDIVVKAQAFCEIEKILRSDEE